MLSYWLGFFYKNNIILKKNEKTQNMQKFFARVEKESQGGDWILYSPFIGKVKRRVQN